MLSWGCSLHRIAAGWWRPVRTEPRGLVPEHRGTLLAQGMMDGMCLALFAWKVVPDHRLLLANNRDEFHWRSTEPVHRWANSPVVAGRDVRGGGTWLGTTASGRIGLLTNVRDGLPLPSREKTAPSRSRGLLVRDFLESDKDPSSFAERLRDSNEVYEPFNLVIGDQNTLRWVTNRGGWRAATLEPGIYGLSNGELDSNWPKVQDGKADFERFLNGPHGSAAQRARGLLDMLANRSRPDNGRLPDTHVPHWIERAVAPSFVQVGLYGTRASTVVDIPDRGAPVISERRFTWFGKHMGGDTTIRVEGPAVSTGG